MAGKPAGIENLLECCICLEECRDPRLLPCAHSLCKKCLEDHIRSSAQGGQVKCPACRHACDIPADGASGVPKNFFLNNLRDILQSQTGGHEQATSAEVVSKAEQPECSNLQMETIPHTSVTAYCVDCTEHLCSHCEYFHRKQNHNLQPVDGVAATGEQTAKSRRSRPRCDQHPALHNDMYCDTCRVPLCMKCCLLKHQLHKYRELDDLVEESKAKLAELTCAAEKHFTILEKHLKKLDVTQENMNRDAEKASRKINEAVDELIDLVTKRRQTLIQEVKEIHALAATEVNAAYKETELNKASVQSLLSYIKALQTSGDVSDHVVHMHGLQEQLRQQEASPLKSVSWTVNFKTNMENLAKVKALLGSVSKQQTVDRPVPLHTLTLPFERNSSSAGITKIGDCVCVVEDEKNHLWMHDLKTNRSKQHTLTALEAAGMTTVGNKSNTLVITNLNKKLHFITINPQNMNITKQLTTDIFFEPRKVVYDHTTDRLIVANPSDTQIIICSKTGDIERRITVKPEVCDMWCALPTAGDAYIVLDNSDPGRVHWVNQSGDVTHTYGAGAGERLNNPCHMLQDSQGRLLVADMDNDCIRLINNQQFSHDLLTENDSIQYPDSIYLDETAGTLYVSYNSDGPTLNVYKWPFTSASPADSDTLSKSFKLNINLCRYH